ncbi:MAG: Hpt domain-containing protein [Atopobiaceae bacterium]|nr:Hpt domain-containing protein [Atopobiaceae bacterium]MBR1829807.1 Hpt domain-containing protein [Atopobiaceae bacterium]
MTLDDLRAFGANVDEGLGRCMGMEAFYLQLAETIKTEQGFDKLKTAVDTGDLDTAFEAAHALKGVLANLAITPVQKPIEEITELLRARTETDYAPLMDTIMSEWERYCAL